MNPQGQKTATSAGAGETVEQELRKLNEEGAKAYLQRDTKALERIWADDFIFTNPFGEVTTKAQEIANVKSGELTFESFTTDDVQVRTFVDVAVLTGRATVKGHYKGQDISGRYRYTDTYVKLEGRWQIIAAQATREGLG